MNSQVYLAVDLGAGSGRVMAARFDGQTLRIEEVNRFTNEGIRLPSGWHWNLPQLLLDIKRGIGLAAKRYGEAVVSISVDTWGVDYGLVDGAGRLLGIPFMYRDDRTDGIMHFCSTRRSLEKIYGHTGIQMMFFNTLFQLTAEAQTSLPALKAAHRLLFMPDLLTFCLSGEQIQERTIASTSQLLKTGTNEWDTELMEAMGIPTHLFGPVTEPNTVVGHLLDSVCEETGAQPIRVVACGGHDTASAVAGVPAETAEPLFLSSGTWSLIGRELRKPLATVETYRDGFSNEQGLNGTTRFLKNVSGMWLLQECKRNWDAQGLATDYASLVEQARAAAISTRIDPDEPALQKPCDMPAEIRACAARTGQPIPQTPGEFARVILESLAHKYGDLIEKLRQLTPNLPDTLHIVGGGSQNELLNQMTADATGLRVVAGPVEATAAGNVVSQLIAAGELSSLEEGRRLVRDSFELKTFEPQK